MDVDSGILRSVQALISLERNEDPVSDSVVFERHFSRAELFNCPFDVVYHNCSYLPG